jgi:hypothetical protein
MSFDLTGGFPGKSLSGQLLSTGYPIETAARDNSKDEYKLESRTILRTYWFPHLKETGCQSPR